MWRSRLAAAACAVLLAACEHPAHALDVDFDAYLIEAELFLGTGFELRGLDNDGNGIKEEDQLGMLSCILEGGSRVASLNPSIVSEILNGYTANYDLIPSKLTVNIPNQGTVNLITQLQSTNPALGVAMQHLLAGYLTIADTATIAFVNQFADDIVAKLLKGTPAEGDTQNVQNQITFTATDFNTYGNAPSQPNYLGPAGDIDGDTQTNLVEYNASATRELWLSANTITPPLRILNATGGGTKVSGLRLEFNASAAGGVGGTTFAWYSGTPPGGTQLTSTSQYVIDFANTFDSGGYYCVLSDGVTTRTTPVFKLTVVYVPLFISQQITGGSRAVGESKTFTVAVQGGQPGPYQYTWRKDGVIVGPNAPSYTINNLQVSDSGEYSVTITSNGGPDAVTSGPRTLTVVPADNMIIVTQPVGGSRRLGESITFSVVVNGGSGNYAYEWRKGGVPIDGANQSSYTISSIVPADAGTYRCQITDIDDPSDVLLSNNATLSITYDPLVITTEPQGATRVVGESHTFTVAAAGGSGEYEYQWRKNGVVIGAPNLPTYTIDNITADDAGIYRCRVYDVNQNNVFVASANAELIVELASPINITTQPQGANKYVGESHTMLITASGGSGFYNYSWRRNGSTFCTNCNFAGITLSNLTLADAASYSCVITDAVVPGITATSNSAFVDVRTRATATVEPAQSILYSGQSLTLTAAATGGYPPYSYTWRRNFMPIDGAPNTALFNLGPIQVAQAGTYDCLVADQYESNASGGATVEVRTKPLPPGGLTFNVNLTPDQALPPHENNSFGIAQGSVVPLGDGALIQLTMNHNVANALVIGLFEGGPGVVGPVLIDYGGGVFGVVQSRTITLETASKIITGYAYLAVTTAEYPDGDIRAHLFPALTIGPVVEHAADQNGDNKIGLSELLRVIQFYNSGAYHCQAGTEDGYAPGFGDQSCPPHSSDYAPQNWVISLSELLRLIQFFNSGAYHPCESGEDGFCAGPG